MPGCEGYYGEEENVDTVDRDKITNEIREQLLKEFGLPARSRVSRSATDNVGTVPVSFIQHLFPLLISSSLALPP